MKELRVFFSALLIFLLTVTCIFPSPTNGHTPIMHLSNTVRSSQPGLRYIDVTNALNCCSDTCRYYCSILSLARDTYRCLQEKNFCEDIEYQRRGGGGGGYYNDPRYDPRYNDRRGDHHHHHSGRDHHDRHDSRNDHRGGNRRVNPKPHNQTDLPPNVTPPQPHPNPSPFPPRPVPPWRLRQPTQPPTQPPNQPINQPTNQPTNQPPNQPLNQPPNPPSQIPPSTSTTGQVNPVTAPPTSTTLPPTNREAGSSVTTNQSTSPFLRRVPREPVPATPL